MLPPHKAKGIDYLALTARWNILPFIITLLAMALNLYALESKSLWFDELGTLSAVGWRGNWIDAIRDPLTIPTTPKPPLHFVIAHFFLALGDRVFLLRLPSALFATATVPLVYVLGKSLFGRHVGLLGALLLAIAPLHIRYAQEARMYALLVFLSILSLYLFWQAIRTEKVRWWVAFGVAAILALYTHLFALLTLGVLVLFGLWLLIRPGGRSHFPFQGSHFIVAIAVILLAYVPMVPFLFEGLVSEEGLSAEPALGWGLEQAASALRLFSGGNDVGLVAYAFLFVLAAVVLFTKRRDILTLTTMWMALPVIIVMATPFGHKLRIRYFLVALPVYLLLVAYGLQVVIQQSVAWIARLQRVGNLRLAATVVMTVVAAAILAGITAPSVSSYYVETQENWRDATRLVQASAKPGDTIWVSHLYHQQGVLFYAAQGSQSPNPVTETSVRLLPADPVDAFSQADPGEHWLVVPRRKPFLPGGDLDIRIQPYHYLLSPTIFFPSNRPRDWRIISSLSFHSVAVVPVATRRPSVSFWADDDAITVGNCTWLRWEVDNVREVYLEDEGIVGHGQRQVCPGTTTYYRLRVIHLDGSSTKETVEIEVSPP